MKLSTLLHIKYVKPCALFFLSLYTVCRLGQVHKLRTPSHSQEDFPFFVLRVFSRATYPRPSSLLFLSIIKGIRGRTLPFVWYHMSSNARNCCEGTIERFVYPSTCLYECGKVTFTQRYCHCFIDSQQMKDGVSLSNVLPVKLQVTD